MNELACYNEIDEFAADWIENLISADLIAPGRVDRRSIVDLTPDDLLRYRQVHLFAGIGIWSASMRDAGIRDDERWWSASCPCQPFSAAGKRNGFADERHLWPYAYHLITQCRPPKIAGEQVASPDGLNWIDLVSTDMEAARYAFGASDLCAAGVTVPAGETQIGQETIEWIRGAILTCPDPFIAAELRDYAEWLVGQVGVGAPHIRQRLYWLADSDSARCGAQRNAKSERHGSVGLLADSTCLGRREERQDAGRIVAGDRSQWRTAGFEPSGDVGTLADADGRHESAERQQRSWQHRQQPQNGSIGLLGDTSRDGQRQPRVTGSGGEQQEPSRRSGFSGHVLGRADDARSQRRIERRNGGDQRPARPAGMAFWSDAEWIICTDGQARPVEVGTFPLARGERSRVGKLRAYGNQIVRPLATQFLIAAQEALSQTQAAE